MGQALSLLPPRKSPAVEASAAASAAAGEVAATLPRAEIERPTFQDPDLWLIVGLGNPGPQFAGTRHNAGWLVVAAVARLLDVAVDRFQANAEVARSRLAGKSVLLAKPLTTMNLSGEAVAGLADFYHIPPERVLVVYDDLDLPTGTVRLRPRGGPGGHGGMKSVAAHLQGDNFPRIRLGIGRPPAGTTVLDHVLQDFGEAERLQVDAAVQQAVGVIRAVLSVGLERAVSGVRVDAAGRALPPPPPSSVAGGQRHAATAAAAGEQQRAEAGAEAAEGQRAQESEEQGAAAAGDAALTAGAAG